MLALDLADAANEEADAKEFLVLTKPNIIKQLAEAYPNAILTAVLAVENIGNNKIPLAYATQISNETFLPVAEIYQTNLTEHNGANAIHSMFSVSEFTGERIAGKEYILVDDVTTSGDTFKAISEYIQSNDGLEVAAKSLCTHRQG